MSLIVINLFPSLDDDDDDEARERKKSLCFYDQIMHETNHLSHEIYHFFLSFMCVCMLQIFDTSFIAINFVNLFFSDFF